jgi:hypothetical protein
MSATTTPGATRAFPGAVARMHVRREGPIAYMVVLAVAPLEAHPDALRQAGQVGCVLTHDRGVTWPDPRGEAMARAVLAEGGGVVLGFETMADALACHRRLAESRDQCQGERDAAAPWQGRPRN